MTESVALLSVSTSQEEEDVGDVVRFGERCHKESAELGPVASNELKKPMLSFPL